MASQTRDGNASKTIWQQLKSKSDEFACRTINCIIPQHDKAIAADEPGPTEAEVCFVLCSMFPEIAVEDLALYGMGLELFKDVNDMVGARDRVPHLLKMLHFVNIQVDEHDNQYVQMRGIGHSLATSMAKRYALVFNPEPKGYRHCYGFVFRKLGACPVNLECSKFSLLRLQYGENSQILPTAFFDVIEVRVLSLDVPSLPQWLNLLRNLRTLHLKVVKVKDMSMIGDLVELEYLSISTSRLTEIPKEMGQLGNLRFLDLRKMVLLYVPPGVFSRMLKLEELYMPMSFTRWGCSGKEDRGNYDGWRLEESDDDDDDDDERINVSLREIGSLSLYALHICVPKASILPKKSPLFRNIQLFKILVPKYTEYQPFGKGSMNVLQLTGDACDINESRICDSMSKTGDLNLTRVRNLKNINYFLCRAEDNDFPQLKKMIIIECEELEYLLDARENWIPCSSFWELRDLHLSMLSNLKEIFHGRNRWTCFGCFKNLKVLNIRFCNKLKYVFPLSIVREMRQIRSIEILDCNEMEGIFCDNVMDDNNYAYGVNFIEELYLYSLPKLIGVLVHKDDTADGDDDATNQSLTLHEVSLMENGGIIRHIEMYCAFSLKLLERRWSCLKKLKITFCDSLEVIFFFKENHATIEVLNSLEELELYGLRNLMHIWFRIPSEIMAFQKLQLLVLSECNNLYLLSRQVAKLLVQLQKIHVTRCEKMKEIVAEEEEKEIEEMIDIIVFPQLKELELQHMPNFRSFCGGTYGIEFPLLESLRINQCNTMESFSYGSLNTPVLQKIQVNGSLYSLIGDLNATIGRLKVEKL